ncbi:MAG: tetraacyldisaccharide 4'-kinase [Robiginitomaculum sp.]
MRAPEFWNHRHGRDAAPVLRALLSPLGKIYAYFTAKRIHDASPHDSGIPIICVGNASVGGTGKTPVTAYLLESFTRMGLGAVALSRGYGGTEKGPIIVSPKHSFTQIGDEPKLLSQYGKVWVAIARDEGAKAAVTAGAKIIIMDDGHQNPYLKKTLSLLVVDAVIGFGNERVFPAGPLREPLDKALGRADVIVLMKPHKNYVPDSHLLAQLKGKPILQACLSSQVHPPVGKLFAFAGIGRPNKFFDTLSREGANLVEALSYKNHYAYKDTDMMNLLDLSKEYGARLITTEKDYVRLPKGFKKYVTCWPVNAVFEDELTVRRILHPIIERAQRG